MRTHHMPGAMLGTLHGQPHLVLSEGPFSSARSSIERPPPRETSGRPGQRWCMLCYSTKANAL